MATLARWCFQHRRLVLFLWIAALVGLTALGRVTGSDYKDAFSLPGTDSQKAIDILERDFPAQSGDSASIVLHARTGALSDPAVEPRATEMLAKIADLPHVAEVVSPFTADGEGQTNPDGTTAFATVALDLPGNELPLDDIERLVDTARSYDSGALQVELTGQVVAIVEQPQQSASELIGVVAAAVILFLAFGSLLAVTLPLITAIMALGVGMALIVQVSHLTTVAEFSTMLATLIGLGVGIDYALFIVNRHRIGLRAGRTPEESAVTAVNTSGRAVIFAGMTVCIALLGLFALGVTFLYGVALAAALTVAMTMLASVTLLPALLGFYGSKVLSRRQRRRMAEHGPEPEQPSGFWWRWAKGVERRPAVLAVLSAGVIVLIAIPFLSLRLGSSDLGNGADTKTSKRGYDLLADGFGPGFNGPFMLVTEINSPADLQTMNQAVEAARKAEGVASVTPPRQSPNGHAAIATLYPTTSPQAAETATLLDRLRDDVIPAATGGAASPVYVGGITAVFEDFSGVLSSKLPLFIGIVVVLAFLLLVVVFRSLLIPLTASLMNLLAVGAAFGAVVAVFQWGWLSDLLGISPGPIESFLPVMLFAILFGLSMDYEVFLVSRMHEEWTARRDNRIAVSLGQAETGRVISAAGAIMTLVFASFILGDDRVIKLFGLGLALAILLDAFVIRTVLVPALMHLFGRANWWLPKGLDRVLPRVSVESAEDIEEIRHTPLPADAVGDTVPAQPHGPADGRDATEPERAH
ncbi:Putative integral membrane export protein, MMPL domain [Parafrankia sp. Ea1.12]|uniref:MMPL family transporter n=1 Tax=Parafrankia sp. Ea1.12 TaxID=573499 RepID=UPI000DA51D39|nr:MMPL family transporter [Parafrankia sp. Ea1.12]SQE00754.1 Putative integral membrane export protein, MMPL domain [Parafrankia sp. Ea1.12]